MEALEQRVSRLYQYIGEPQGDIFATAKQVQRLETIIQNQQQIIDRLQSQQTFFQQDVTAYFEQQLQHIINQKGIRNTDFITLSKFFTQNLTTSVKTLQAEFSNALKNSLQTEKIQELEIQVKRLKNAGTKAAAPPSENTGSSEKIQELETRIRLLEIQPLSQAADLPLQTETQSTEQLDTIQQEISVLQDHVKHLEDNLIKDVQKHYTMSTKQGELAAPLTRIQNTVQMLDREFQSFRGIDVRKVAEAMIHTSTENLRTEFQTALATRASMEQLNKFDADVRRIEAYSTDVQTGFYKMKNHLEDITAKMTDSFSETRWSKLENSLKKSLDTKHKEQHATWTALLETQESEIQRTVHSIQRSAEKVFEDVKANTSPEAFDVQLQRLQNALIQSQDGWLEKVAEPLQSRMTAVEQQSQQTRSGFLELTSEMKTELAATSLKSKYAEFEEKLAGFNKITEGWNKRLQKSEEAHKQILAFSEARAEKNAQSMLDLETEFSRIRITVSELQQQTKTTLDSWLRDRKGDIQKRFTDAAQEIQYIQRNAVALESELYKQLEIYRNQERVWADKYREYQAAAETTVVAWREEQSTYIISRMAELSSEVRKQLASTEERMSEMGGFNPSSDPSDPYEYNKIRDRLVEMTTRINQLNETYNPTAMRKMQTEIETGLRTANDEWLKKRAEHIMKGHIDTFQTQIDTLNTTIAEDRSKFMKRYELMTEAEKAQIKRLNESHYTENATRMREFILNETDTIRVEILQKVESDITRHFTAYKTLIDKIYVTSGKSRTGNAVNPMQLEYQSHTKCFYTALFGGPDQKTDILSQVYPIAGWDYICFTNLDIQDSKGWTIVKVEPVNASMALEAKKYKWLSHTYLEDYDIVVWVDAYIAPISIAGDKIYQWVTLMKERGLTILHRKHEKRNCIWDECDAVVELRRDTPENVNKIRKILTIEKMPRNIGLYDTNIMVRFHKDKYVKQVSEQIMKMLMEYTPRDQLVVSLVYYKNGFNEFSTTDLMRAFEKNGTHVRIPAY